MTTPMRKKRSMFEKDLGISPLRKSAVTSTPFPNQVVNDDEIERSRRRSILENAKRLSSVNHLNRSTSASDNSECNDHHYNTCLKLFMENKINTKNVWQLHIIEYMRSRLIKDGVETQDHLQMASSSLEIAAKVYGMRVDDMHQESLRLVAALMEVHTDNNENRNENNDEELNADSDNDNENGRKSAQKNKEKRKKKRLSIGDMTGIIALKEECLNAKLTIHNTSYKQQGKQLNVLIAKGALAFKEELLVPYRGNMPFWTHLPPENADVKFSKLVQAKIIQVPGLICPSFNDFVVDQWDPNDDSLCQSRSSEHILYDDNGFPIPELDTSVPNFDVGNDTDNCGGACSDFEEEMVAGAHAALHTEIAHITEMRPNENNASTENGIRSLEYSYISAPIIGERYTITGVWAGPSHWKLKSLQPRASSTISVQGVTAHKQKRVPRLETLQMNFLEIDEEELEHLLSFTKKTIKKKRHHIEEFTLPEDLCVDKIECHTLMSIPSIHIRMTADRTADSCNENLNITHYDYDNPNDADYCSQTLTDDADHDDVNADEYQLTTADQTVVDYNNMVNAPNYVPKTVVPYATQAKKMDIKKLKDAIWKELVKNDENNTTVIDNATPSTEHFLNVSFEKMYDGLPNRVSEKMASELSVPLAFVAMLHLANERNLKLMGQSDLLDVLVSTVT